jgi:hypothetical protein
VSALAEKWVEPRVGGRTAIALTWWLAALIGGAIGGAVPHPLQGAAASAAAVGLLQTLSFRPDLRYGAGWFCASALAGSLGFGAAVIGGLAFADLTGGEPAALREGLAAWAALSAIGGLLLAAAQAPLTGRRGLGIVWCLLGLCAGAVLWPAGLTLGHRLGVEASREAASLLPQLADHEGSLRQAVEFAMAWFLHSLPFGLMVAANDRR